MPSVLDYSTTANSNTTVGGVFIGEGMLAGKTNDGMRAMMADSRKWQLDWSGVVTAGSSNAYTITSNQGISAYADSRRFSFRADRNNTGAATLNVDSRGAKALRKVSGGALTALAADDIVADAVYDVVYDLSSDVFAIVGFAPPTISAFALTLLDDANQGAMQTTLGLVPGTNVQAQDAFLQDIADLTDPNADRVLFWDDSAGEIAFLTMGADLAITGTTLAIKRTETSVISLSGSSTNISTSIPAGVKRIKVWINGVSMTGASGYNQLQVSTGSAFVTTGYDRAASSHEGASTSSTSGFITMASNNQNPSAANSGNVCYDLRLVDAATNTWMCAHAGSTSVGLGFSGNGTIALAGALDGLRLIVTGSGGTFDAGTAFAEWEF